MKKIFITEVVKYALIIGISVIALVWASLSRSTMTSLENTLDTYLQSAVNIIDYDERQYNYALEEYKSTVISYAYNISLLVKADTSILHSQSFLDSLRKTMNLDEIIITDETSKIEAFTSADNSSRELCMHINEFLVNSYQSDFKKYEPPVYCDRHKSLIQYTAAARRDKPGMVIIGKKKDNIAGSLQSNIIGDISLLYPIYKNGFIAVVDKDSHIILSYKSKKHIGYDIEGLGINVAALKKATKVVPVKIENKKGFALLRDYGTYSLIAIAYKNDVYFGVYVYIAIILASILLTIIFMQLFMLQAVNQHIISGISYIIECLNSIKKDNIDKKVELNTCEEFKILSESINSMVSRLRNLLLSEKNLVLEKESLAAAKGDFLAMMSHEIRTPLNVVIGMTQMGMRSDYSKEQVKETFANINTASTHLLSLLNDILDMSKIDAGKLELVYAPFSLIDDMRHINMLVYTKAVDRELQFNVSLEGIDDYIVISDKLRLNQVLLNLLSNAVKFTNKGKSISLTVKKLSLDNNHITVSFTVEDEGIGMNQEKLDKIFKPFEQADTSISRSFGGTGLGLSISSNIVELMGGKINVTSQYGSGSKFSFQITFQLGSLENSIDENAFFKENSLSQYRCLMVDDVELNRTVISSFLEKTGIKIDEAENGSQAVDMYLKAPNGYYNFIFMDIHMPKMDGYEAAKTIRHSDKMDALTIPIIAVTADAFKDTEEQVLACGMTDFISKPIKFNNLKKIIDKVLQNQLNTNESIMVWTKINNLE